MVRGSELAAAIAVCGAWLATNLYNVAEYMADARVQELPLVTVGGWRTHYLPASRGCSHSS